MNDLLFQDYFTADGSEELHLLYKQANSTMYKSDCSSKEQEFWQLYNEFSTRLRSQTTNRMPTNSPQQSSFEAHPRLIDGNSSIPMISWLCFPEENN